MFDMTEIIVGQVQTILDTTPSEKKLAICSIVISIISLCISFYNTIVLNKSSLIVSFHFKEFFDEDAKKICIAAEISIVNNSRRTKYINHVGLKCRPRIYSSLTVSQELKKIEPEEEIRIPIHLTRRHFQNEPLPRSAKVIVSDTTGRKWRSKSKISQAELNRMIERH